MVPPSAPGIMAQVRAAATAHLENGAAITELQGLLGRQSLSMTQFADQLEALGFGA